MLKRSLLIALFLPVLLFADVLDQKLESQPESALVLNTVVLHQETESFRTGIHPINAVEFLGSVGSTRLIYTSYISTNGKDTRLHTQRLELYAPDGRKILYSGEKSFEVGTYRMKFGPFQRGYLEQEIKFPPLNKGNAKNFGVYRLKIFLDGRFRRIFYIPLFAQ